MIDLNVSEQKSPIPIAIDMSSKNYVPITSGLSNVAHYSLESHSVNQIHGSTYVQTPNTSNATCML